MILIRIDGVFKGVTPESMKECYFDFENGYFKSAPNVKELRIIEANEKKTEVVMYMRIGSPMVSDRDFVFKVISKQTL